MSPRPDSVTSDIVEDADEPTLFKYAPGLKAECDRIRVRMEQDRMFDEPMIPLDVQNRIVRMVNRAGMQWGAMHALGEVEQWLRDNNLKIVKEQQCESQSLEQAEPSADTSSSP